MAEISWTRESEIWLKDIYDYIAADDPHAAAQTITSIYENRNYSEVTRASVLGTKPKPRAKFVFSSTNISA